MNILNLMGEINRVNLASACAVSATRTPAAGRGSGRGGRGGRRGGHGGRHGSSLDQDHSDSDEDPPFAADTDPDFDCGMSIDNTGIPPCVIYDDIGPSTTHDTPPTPFPTTLHDDIELSSTHDTPPPPFPTTLHDDIELSSTHDTSSSPLPPTPHDDTVPYATHEAPRFPLPSTPMSATLTTNVAPADSAGGSSVIFASLSSAPTVDTTDSALACPSSNSLPTQPTTTTLAGQNPSSSLVQQVPTLTWPENSELDLDWIKNLISTFDWSSKNLPPSEFPSVLPVQAFDTLILTASKILHKEPNCLTIDPDESSTVVIVGDIHGQLHDLIFLLKQAGFPSQNRFFVFNGDYVDRGAWGLETFLLLLAWKVFHFSLINQKNPTLLCYKFSKFWT